MFKRYKKIYVILTICIVILVIFLLKGGNILHLSGVGDISVKGLDQCFEGVHLKALETTKERHDCIKIKVSSLLDSYSAKSLVETVMSPQTSQVIKNNCHQIMHEVGKQTLERSKGDIEVAIQSCSSGCGGGCFHGVVAQAVEDRAGGKVVDSEDLAHANMQELEKEGEKYCSDTLEDSFSFKESLCHALGHIIFMNLQDPNQSVVECDKIAKEKNQKRACYYGLFMEFVGGADSFSSQKIKIFSKAETGYISQCLGFEELSKKQCFRAVLKVQAVANNDLLPAEKRAQTFIHVCKVLSVEDASTCFFWFGVFSMSGDFENSSIKNREMCNLLVEDSEKESCTVGQANFVMSTEDKDNKEVFKYCDSKSESLMKVCYKAIFKVKLFTKSNVSILCKSSKNFNICVQTFQSSALNPVLD